MGKAIDVIWMRESRLLGCGLPSFGRWSIPVGCNEFHDDLGRFDGKVFGYDYEVFGSLLVRCGTSGSLRSIFGIHARTMQYSIRPSTRFSACV